GSPEPWRSSRSMDRIPGVRSRRSWKTGEPVSSLDGIGGIVRVGRCDSLPELPEFARRAMPSEFRLLRRTVPAPDTSPVLLIIENPDMAADGVGAGQPGVAETIRCPAWLSRATRVGRTAHRVRPGVSKGSGRVAKGPLFRNVTSPQFPTSERSAIMLTRAYA